MTSERLKAMQRCSEAKKAIADEICEKRCKPEKAEECNQCRLPALLGELGRAERHAAVLEKEEWKAAMELPWKKMHVGQVVWFLWWDDDANAWEIGQEVATAVGYEGFWYSGDLKNPLSADAFVPWDRIGIDAFLTQQAARERMEAANE